MVVGKDNQTRQRQLKAKIVKASQSRHYIKDPCCVQQGGSNSNLEEKITTRKQVLRKGEKKKEKRKIRNKEGKQRDRMTGMHQQVDHFSPSKSLALCEKQKILLGTSHSSPLASK